MTSNNNLVTVVFRNHVMPDEQASKTAGRPIFTEMEVCDITFAANTKTKATFPAHDAEPNATREGAVSGGGVRHRHQDQPGERQCGQCCREMAR